LGIPDLRDLNICWMVSWVQRYYESGDKLWKAIIDAKCSINSPNFSVVMRETLPPFGKGSCGLHGLLGWDICGK
jgi:hypothetical protein